MTDHIDPVAQLEAENARLRDAIARAVASLESNGAWKVANAKNILRPFTEREKTTPKQGQIARTGKSEDEA